MLRVLRRARAARSGNDGVLPVCRRVIPVLALAAGILIAASSAARAQGVTTGSLSGVVTDAQQNPVAGGSVIAIHLPSGTPYETTTRQDGRYVLPNMRVGGPYVVTVTYVGEGTAFEPVTREDVMVNLGVMTDLDLTVQTIALE